MGMIQGLRRTRLCHAQPNIVTSGLRSAIALMAYSDLRMSDSLQDVINYESLLSAELRLEIPIGSVCMISFAK